MTGQVLDFISFGSAVGHTSRTIGNLTSNIPDKTAVIMPSGVYDHNDGPCKTMDYSTCI